MTARARWRSRPSSAASSPGRGTSTTPRARAPTPRGRRCSTPASRLRWWASVCSSSTALDVGHEKESSRSTRPPAKKRRASSGRTARRPAPASCSAACSAPWSCRTWASSAAARASPNFIIGSDADVDAPVSPEFSPSSSHQLVVRDRRRLRRQRHPAHDGRGLSSTARATSCSSSSSSAAPASRCRRAARRGSTAARRRSWSRRRRARARSTCRS